MRDQGHDRAIPVLRAQETVLPGAGDPGLGQGPGHALGKQVPLRSSAGTSGSALAANRDTAAGWEAVTRATAPTAAATAPTAAATASGAAGAAHGSGGWRVERVRGAGGERGV